mmetsp:Transcript_52826/g.107367  ORF Transcript_52826/g.107367 Transcript_52826/m.107367 type:complete len:201 (-) Transcript_52826:124-726(-)
MSAGRIWWTWRSRCWTRTLKAKSHWMPFRSAMMQASTQRSSWASRRQMRCCWSSWRRLRHMAVAQRETASSQRTSFRATTVQSRPVLTTMITLSWSSATPGTSAAAKGGVPTRHASECWCYMKTVLRVLRRLQMILTSRPRMWRVSRQRWLLRASRTSRAWPCTACQQTSLPLRRPMRRRRPHQRSHLRRRHLQPTAAPT